jgi:uncharacterized OB-fold protein
MSTVRPRIDVEAQPFWDAAARRELVYQQCQTCGATQSYPRHRCMICHGTALGWKPSSRRGKIHSFTVVHRAPSDAFRSRVPYVLALVALEGFRLLVNLPEDRPEEAAIGRDIEIVFVNAGGMWLPQGKLL